MTRRDPKSLRLYIIYKGLKYWIDSNNYILMSSGYKIAILPDALIEESFTKKIDLYLTDNLYTYIGQGIHEE